MYLVLQGASKLRLTGHQVALHSPDDGGSVNPRLTRCIRVGHFAPWRTLSCEISYFTHEYLTHFLLQNVIILLLDLFVCIILTKTEK